MSLNRDIYNRMYAAKGLELNPDKAYDSEMVDIRLRYGVDYGTDKHVLDLCCGSGAYLIPLLPNVKSAVGLDFSRNLLNTFQKKLSGGNAAKVRLVEGDAQQLPFPDAEFEFVFSYCALYYLPRLDLAISEISRVMKSGAHAVLECGNRSSLNQPVTMAFHEESGWAKPFYFPYGEIRKWLGEAGLEVVAHRAFQLLPMYGSPRKMRPIMPLLSPRWKDLLGVKVGGRMLDEWLSTSKLLRRLAFRHMFLVRKP